MRHQWVETLHQAPQYAKQGDRTVVTSHGYTRRKCSGCGMEWVSLGMATRALLADGTYAGGAWALNYDCEGGK